MRCAPPRRSRPSERSRLDHVNLVRLTRTGANTNPARMGDAIEDVDYYALLEVEATATLQVSS